MHVAWRRLPEGLDVPGLTLLARVRIACPGLSTQIQYLAESRESSKDFYQTYRSMTKARMGLFQILSSKQGPAGHNDFQECVSTSRSRWGRCGWPTTKFQTTPGQRSSVLMTGQEKLHSYSHCLLYTSPSPRDGLLSRMPSSA